MFKPKSTGEVWVEDDLTSLDWCCDYRLDRCFDVGCTQIHLYEYCLDFMNNHKCTRGVKCNYLHDWVLFRNCGRKPCGKVHDFLYCQYRDCGSHNCKRLHLTPEQTENVRMNRRPFSEEVVREVDRIAWVYKRMFGNEQNKICTRLLTGMQRCIQECRTCVLLERPLNLQCQDIMGNRYGIFVNGYNDDYETLYNFAMCYNTRRLKVVVKKMAMGVTESQNKKDTPKLKARKRKISPEEDVFVISPRNIFQNEVVSVDGITSINIMNPVYDIQPISHVPMMIPVCDVQLITPAPNPLCDVQPVTLLTSSRTHDIAPTSSGTHEMGATSPITEAADTAYKNRIFNKPNICKFCKQTKTNIKRHILALHNNEAEVKEFQMMTDDNPNKKKLLAQIRRDGTFEAFRSSEKIIPSRISKYIKPEKSSYIACSCCKILLKKESLAKHLRYRCIKNPTKSTKEPENTGNYEKPTLPTEVGTALKYLIQIHMSECIKNNDIKEKEMAKNLLHLLKTALPAHVNKTAMESLLKQKRTKILVLPSNQDIQKFNSYLLTKRNYYYNKLIKEYDFNSWINLGSYTLISILIFNRRRPGELERCLISDLESLNSIDDNTETFKKLNENDEKYVKEYVRFVIRGKLARGVPVLLRNSMHECIKLILKYRQEAGVADGNPFIFGLPQCRPNDRNVVYRHLSATTLMRKYSQECNAENPQSLRATTLRKHIATVSMSLNLNNEEIQLLQGYLGHADKIHKEYYRQPLMERDILNVSRVLHAAQSTSPVLATVFQNIPNTSTAEQPGTPITSAVPSTSAIISRPATPSTSAILNTSGTILPDTMDDSFESGSEFNANNNDSDDSNCEELLRTHKYKRQRLMAFSPCQTTIKRTWETPERHAARKTFSHYLTQGYLPTTSEIVEAIDDCPELKNRTIPQIKMWIANNTKKS
ncbi:hypothetical protein JTB14_032913 [Gonioctena quinquepunctata]|nr:hypothetical protein JTB14_032913 [Gonioctena quinquepunctata]